MKVINEAKLHVTARTLNPGDTFRLVYGNSTLYMVVDRESLRIASPMPENKMQPVVRIENGEFGWVDEITLVIPVSCEVRVLSAGETIR